MFTRCPHCSELLHIQISITHVAQQQDDVRRLLNNWQGLTGWGQIEEEMLSARIAQHGLDRVEESIKECVKSRSRNWRYLDKVLETIANRPDPGSVPASPSGGLEDLLLLVDQPASKPVSEVKPVSPEVADFRKQCEDLF